MYQSRIKRGFQFLVLIALVTFAFQPAFGSNGPELPDQCSLIAVEPGHKLAFHVYAKGVQIYKWNGVSWDFDAPLAALFAEENFFGEVGTHSRGPKWESKSGSRVNALPVPGRSCQPDPTAVTWLQLQVTETNGKGIFKDITFIQRTNTTGGLRPTTPGTTIGEVQEVEYTAEYYFYKAENPSGN